MTTFKQAAIKQENSEGQTHNGARTNKSSLNKCLDLFFLAGASRGKDISPLFEEAYKQDRETALRILLWMRDIRGGAGERDTFRKLYNHLPKINYCESVEDFLKVSRKIPEVGRWDDLWSSDQIHQDVIAFIKEQLNQGNSLLAKWLPRDTGKHKEKANALAHYLCMSPKNYRKRIVQLSKTVEQQMCAKEWGEINYSHVPSVASSRYQKAFGRNDSERYGSYLTSLEKGDKDVKINTTTLFPHDVIRSSRFGDKRAAELQWKNLPDYLKGNKMKILPLIDVSGSMDTVISGSCTAKDASIGIGIYCAERIEGPFKNLVMTFSSSSRVVDISEKSNLHDKLKHVDDGFIGSTNIEAAFNKILEIAVKQNVKQDDMPEYLLILSDMEFNAAVNCQTFGIYTRTSSKPVSAAMDMAKEAYRQAGYELPNIIFWNLNGRKGNSPVTFDEKKTALISGYSPSIMSSILACDGKLDPINMMLTTVNVSRYDLN